MQCKRKGRSRVVLTLPSVVLGGKRIEIGKIHKRMIFKAFSRRLEE